MCFLPDACYLTLRIAHAVPKDCLTLVRPSGGGGFIFLRLPAPLSQCEAPVAVEGFRPAAETLTVRAASPSSPRVRKTRPLRMRGALKGRLFLTRPLSSPSPRYHAPQPSQGATAPLV